MENGVKNQIIEGTNLYIFSKNAKTGDFTYSRPINAEEAKEVADKTPGLKVAQDGSLTYMNTLRGIKANRELTRQTSGNVWLPTIQEGFLLHDAKLLPSGEVMDFGIALYNAENPDKQIAEKLMADAKKNGYEVPILASFKQLDLENGGDRYGVTPVFVSKEGLITGKDAVKLLGRFTYRGNSGVHRLYRYNGNWDADWDVNLGYTNGDCRVGRVSAVGSAKNLRELAESQIKQNYTDARSKLEDEIREINTQENASIASADRLLA